MTRVMLDWLYLALACALLLAGLALWDAAVARWHRFVAAQVERHVPAVVRIIRKADCADGVHRTQIVLGVYLTERCVDCGESWPLGVAFLSGTNRRTKRGTA